MLNSNCHLAHLAAQTNSVVPTEHVRQATAHLNELIRRAYSSPNRSYAHAPRVLPLGAPGAQHALKACAPAVSRPRLSATCAIVGRSGMGKSHSIKALLAAGEWL